MTKKPDHITLNFSEAFLFRLRAYAERHKQKLNAVLREGFEVLEDRELMAKRKAELLKEEAPY